MKIVILFKGRVFPEELKSSSRCVLGVEIGWTKANTKVSLHYTVCWNIGLCKIHLGINQNLAIRSMLGGMQTRKSYEKLYWDRKMANEPYFHC